MLNTLHEKGWFKSLAALIGVLVGLVALGTALVPLFRHGESARNPVATPQAYQTPVVPPPSASAKPESSDPRALDDAAKQKLLWALSNKSEIITVVGQRSDAEVAKYAREILAFLKSQGYRNTSLAFTNFPGTFEGLEIDASGSRAFVKVGRR
ncbi:MAG: hypothetical protein SFW62_07815 [Alphaproteobacteria bacterium]|nr:hypothetical protein [Alphaproteobacteria bacterium]